MIKANNISFEYIDNNLILDNISFEIKKGDFIAFLGANGSGKSTLSKIIAGLIKPKSGEIYIDNILLDQKSIDNLRSKIGIISQNPDNQFIGSSVYYDLAFGFENENIDSKIIKEKIKKIIHDFNLKDIMDKSPEELSGGQKQKVLLAGLIALNKEIFILDEALAMLDPDGEKHILNLITDLKKLNKTIILITHNLNQIQMANRFFILENKKLTIINSIKELFENKKLIEKANLVLPFELDLIEKVKNDQIKKDLWDYFLKM